jgi:hypothetical protein
VLNFGLHQEKTVRPRPQESASPPHKQLEDGLVQPAAASRTNLADALALLSRWRLSKPWVLGQGSTSSTILNSKAPGHSAGLFTDSGRPGALAGVYAHEAQTATCVAGHLSSAFPREGRAVQPHHPHPQTVDAVFSHRRHERRCVPGTLSTADPPQQILDAAAPCPDPHSEPRVPRKCPCGSFRALRRLHARAEPAAGGAPAAHLVAHHAALRRTQRARVYALLPAGRAGRVGAGASLAPTYGCRCVSRPHVWVQVRLSPPRVGAGASLAPTYGCRCVSRPHVVVWVQVRLSPPRVGAGASLAPT